MEALIVKNLGENAEDRPSLSQSKVYARVGVLPRLDLGVQMTGFIGGVGADAKLQLLRRPLLVAASAGLGRSEIGYCLSGCTDEKIETRHASLLRGKGRFYGAATIMDYPYRREGDHQGPIVTEKLASGITLGLTRGRGRVRGLGEVNVYFLRFSHRLAEWRSAGIAGKAMKAARQ